MKQLERLCLVFYQATPNVETRQGVLVSVLLRGALGKGVDVAKGPWQLSTHLLLSNIFPVFGYNAG